MTRPDAEPAPDEATTAGGPPEAVPGRMRLDAALVQRGLARSRARARELVDNGQVIVDGAVATKAARPVGAANRVELGSAPSPWVGRAAHKLLAALDEFGPRGLDAAGKACLDVGASTGGFTQVLLSRGARRVVALDVGHGQLAPAVAADPRVEERSGTNVRDVAVQDLGGPFDLVVADLSFISLRLVLPVLGDLTGGPGDLVVLVKPQFEVGRDQLGRGGVVRGAARRRRAVLDVVEAAGEAGLAPHGLAASPLTGAGGNVEYLLWLRRVRHGMMSAARVHDTATAITQEGPT